MTALFKNRLTYLSLALILLVVAFPLISIGTTSGPAFLWWTGLLALTAGGLIPPLQRLLLGAPASPPAAEADSAPDASPTLKGDSHESR